MGRPDTVLTYDPNIFQKVLRTEGQYPVRNGLETLAYYRNHIGPDMYRRVGDLATQSGEKWFNVRSKVNPIMAQPRAVKMYVEKIDEVVRDFVDHIREIRDSKTLEMSDTFGHTIKCFTMEMVGVVAIDQRLHSLKNPSEESLRLINVSA